MKSGEYSHKFIRQVQNMINKNVDFVEIIVTFYDRENGEMIGSKSTSAEPRDFKSKNESTV